MDPENQNDEELALALQRALGAGACSTPPPAPSDARLAVARLAGKGIGSGTKRPPAAAAQQGPGSDGAPPARTPRLVSPARPPRKRAGSAEDAALSEPESESVVLVEDSPDEAPEPTRSAPPRGYGDKAVRQVTRLLRHGDAGRGDRLTELPIGGWLQLSDVELLLGLPREVILDIVENDKKRGKARFEKTHGQGIVFVRAAWKRSVPAAAARSGSAAVAPVSAAEALAPAACWRG